MLRWHVHLSQPQIRSWASSLHRILNRLTWATRSERSRHPLTARTAQSRGAQTNPPCDLAPPTNVCCRATFVGPDAFFNSRHNWPTSRRAARSLFCAVGAIAGIPQTWDNEPSLIESIVDRRRPKMNIGMNTSHPLHSFLSGNQTDETDVLCSAFF